MRKSPARPAIATVSSACGGFGRRSRTTASRPSRSRSRWHSTRATLAQLLFVRTTLRLDDRTDRFLAAALTGILHGKSASYLSELMPNTFSMAPRYVRDFADAHRVRIA